jgi:hypothetical protein
MAGDGWPPESAFQYTARTGRGFSVLPGDNSHLRKPGFVVVPATFGNDRPTGTEGVRDRARN